MSLWSQVKRVLRLSRDGGDLPGDQVLPSQPSREQQADWLAADVSGFGVPVLDLFSATREMQSAAGDADAAARAISWSNSTGAELDASELVDVAPLPGELRFPADPLLGDGLLFTPREMEEKWVLALRDGELLVARSWTGTVTVAADARPTDGELVVSAVRMRDAGLAAFGDPLMTLDWLIRSHALGQALPLPVDENGARILEAQPSAVFSPFGHMARWAARSWDPPAPNRPLRSDGALIHATRASQAERVRELSAAGASVDAPSPVLGLRPLAIAAIQGNAAMVALLLELGADPNLGNDKGLVPMGEVIVHGGDSDLMEVLRDGGAATDITNADGFNLLHAAAETNRHDLVDWLFAHGVPLEGRTQLGITPLHVACGLGHLEAAEALLRAGADTSAIDPRDGLNAVGIAAKWNHDDVVALLERESP